MDSTQDIIKGYLDGGKYLKSQTLSDSEDEYDIDSLVDPLDQTTDFGKHPVTLPSPPTPHQSPLKAHLNKLRESPVKTSRISPTKTREENIDLSFFSRYDDDELIDTHKHVNKVPENISSSKELERYSLLLASSTEKLMKQLAAERRKTRDLELRIANHENDKFQAQVTKQDYVLLKRQFAGLQEKSDQILRKYREYEDDNIRLTRENLLLREKLIKYKKLYENSQDGRSIHKSEGPQRALADFERPQEQQYKRQLPRSGSQEINANMQQSGEKAEDNSLSPRPTKGSNLVDVESALQRLAELLVKTKQELVYSRRYLLPQTRLESPDDARPIVDEKLSESKYHEHHEHEYNQVLNGLVQSVDQIGMDLKQINFSLRQEHESLPNREETVDRDREGAFRNDASTLQSGANYSSKYGRTFHSTSRGDGDLHGKTGSEKVCLHSDRPLSSCSACAKAYNKVSRPPSHSTMKNDSHLEASSQSEGNTQALMGRYMWNRTI